jgi:hypothetical protein
VDMPKIRTARDLGQAAERVDANRSARQDHSGPGKEMMRIPDELNCGRRGARFFSIFGLASGFQSVGAATKVEALRESQPHLPRKWLPISALIAREPFPAQEERILPATQLKTLTEIIPT